MHMVLSSKRPKASDYFFTEKFTEEDDDIPKPPPSHHHTLPTPMMASATNEPQWSESLPSKRRNHTPMVSATCHLQTPSFSLSLTHTNCYLSSRCQPQMSQICWEQRLGIHDVPVDRRPNHLSSQRMSGCNRSSVHHHRIPPPWNTCVNAFHRCPTHLPSLTLSTFRPNI